MRRRRLLHSTSILLAGGLAGCNALDDGGSIPRDDGLGAETDLRWPRPGFDGENRRYNPGGVVPDDPTPAWTRTVSLSLGDPVVTDGAVFVHDADLVVALDATDGSQRWSAPAHTSPAVSGSTVAVGHGTDVALNRLEDGHEVERLSGEHRVSAAPAPIEDGGFAVVQGERVGVRDDSTDGEVWQRRLFGTIDGGVSTRDSHYLAAATRAGEVSVLTDQGRGADRWTLSTAATGRPVLDAELESVLVTTFDGQIHARGLEGETEWSRRANSRADVVLAGGYAYIPRGSGVDVRDVDTGERAYRATVDSTARSLAVAADSLLVPTADGSVLVLDRFDGTERARIDVGETAYRVVPAAERLFVHCLRDGTSTLAVYE